MKRQIPLLLMPVILCAVFLPVVAQEQPVPNQVRKKLKSKSLSGIRTLTVCLTR